MVLAGRAVAVAAGDDGSRGFPARFARKKVVPEAGVRQLIIAIYCLTMFPRDSVTKPRQVLRGIGAENLIDRIHD